MMKECFKQAVVDTTKFRECAACPLFEPCTGSVTLKEQKTASYFGQVLGAAVALAGFVLAALFWPRIPNGAWWLVFVSAVYLLSVFAAGREYRERNAEETEEILQAVEAR